MADTIFWENDRVMLLDQTKLPVEQVYLACEDYRAVAAAIQGMVVRGAPAIGVAAAMGIALVHFPLLRKGHRSADRRILNRDAPVF